MTTKDNKKEPVQAAPEMTSVTVHEDRMPSQPQIMQNPKAVIAMGTEMAVQLKSVIESANLITRIGGGEHIQFEGWQTLGAFFGVTPKTERTETIKNDKGETFAARAYVELVDNLGHTVGGAEAICSRAERNWATKDWFQLESMAQTRAAAKALRMKYSWIVVLAGYNPTPAEEMTHETVAPKAEPVNSKLADAIKDLTCPKCLTGGIRSKSGVTNGKAWTLLGCTRYPDCDYKTFNSANAIQMEYEHAVQQSVVEEPAVDLETIKV
jgi:hypothetical protein